MPDHLRSNAYRVHLRWNINVPHARVPHVQDDDIRLLCVALERNSSLTSIDLRMNDVSADLEDLEKIEVGRRLVVDLANVLLLALMSLRSKKTPRPDFDASKSRVPNLCRIRTTKKTNFITNRDHETSILSCFL